MKYIYLDEIHIQMKYMYTYSHAHILGSPGWLRWNTHTYIHIHMHTFWVPQDGLDEISPSSPTIAWILQDNKIEEVGLHTRLDMNNALHINAYVCVYVYT
jgi:hypothetical protein